MSHNSAVEEFVECTSVEQHVEVETRTDCDETRIQENLQKILEGAEEAEEMLSKEALPLIFTPPQLSAYLQPQMQSIPVPAPTILPYTSRSTEAKMFAAQQAWLLRAAPNLVNSANLDPPFGTIIGAQSQISLQASKLRSKAKEESGSGPTKCQECREWFFSYEKLTIHMISNHGKHHCSYCNEMFEADVEREEHEKVNHFPLECDICNLAVDNMDEHYEEVHDMRNCRFCGVLVKPKSYYQIHVRRKHYVNCLETLEERDVRLVGNWSENSDAWNFNCHLCGKERKRADIFGHFYSYHRLSLLCFVVFLRTEQMLFTVQGTLAPAGVQKPPGDSIVEDCSKSAQLVTSHNVHSDCTACTKPFTFQVPKPAHDIFCLGLTICRYCSATFADANSRNAHILAEHTNFPCTRGCDSTFTELELSLHHSETHSEVSCRFCETFLPNNLSTLADHLQTKHATSSRSKALIDKDIDLIVPNGHSFTCSLCSANITSSMHDLRALSKHLQYHNISLTAMLALLESHQLTATFKPTKIIKKAAKTLDRRLVERSSKKPGHKKRLKSKKLSEGQELDSSRTEENGCNRGTVIMGVKPLDDSENNGASFHNADSSSTTTTEDEEDFESSDDENKEETKLDVSVSDMGDAEIDPTEIECVINDTSDDEEYDVEDLLQVSQFDMRRDDDQNAEMQALDCNIKDDCFQQNFRETVVKRTGDKCLDLIERTMEDIFQDAPRLGRVAVEVRINEGVDDSLDLEQGGSDSKENSNVMNNHSYANNHHMEKNHRVKSKSDRHILEESVRNMKPDPDQLTAQQVLAAIFKCELCVPEQNTTLTSAIEYARHMRTHHKFAISAHCSQKQPAGGEIDLGILDHVDQEGMLDEVFECPFCSIRSMWKTAIRQHVWRTHAADCSNQAPVERLAYACRYCELRFWRATERNEHQITSHDDQIYDFYKCYVCSQISSSRLMLLRHMKVSHPAEPQYSAVSYKCKLCLLTYPSLGLLREHFAATHPAAMVFPCTHCSITLKNKTTLRSHIKSVHVDGSDRRRDCTLCGKVLYSKRAQAIHYRMKHSQASKVGFRCRICQQRFDTKDDRKMHYAVEHQGESPYHCTECGKGFASKSGMYGHKQLHTGSGISKCQYCGKEFTRKDSYNEHLLIHNGPRHKCPHCPKEFVQRSNLVRHIRIHTGEKPYKCVYCDKCFSDKGACNSHIRVHTREETCSCPYCGQSFSKKQKLKYHIRKHTGEGLINCEVCSKSFTNSFALKEHRLIHNRETSILCGTCGKGFNSEKYLSRHHAIVHEPHHTFVCPLCSKTFSQQSRLKSHLMTHTGVKHMKCLLCDKAYSVRKSLRRHLLEKHQVAPDHPQYRRCFYAMTHQEAGLQIPEDMSFFASLDGDSSHSSPKHDEEVVKRSPRKSGKKPVYIEPEDEVVVKKRRKKEEKPSTSKPEDSESSSETSEEEVVVKKKGKKGISNIVDRLQKRLGPGKQKRRVEEIAETLQKTSPAVSSDDEPVMARMHALNSSPKGNRRTERAGSKRPGKETS